MFASYNMPGIELITLQLWRNCCHPHFGVKGAEAYRVWKVMEHRFEPSPMTQKPRVLMTVTYAIWTRGMALLGQGQGCWQI